MTNPKKTIEQLNLEEIEQMIRKYQALLALLKEEEKQKKIQLQNRLLRLRQEREFRLQRREMEKKKKKFDALFLQKEVDELKQSDTDDFGMEF